MSFVLASAAIVGRAAARVAGRVRFYDPILTSSSLATTGKRAPSTLFALCSYFGTTPATTPAFFGNSSDDFCFSSSTLTQPNPATNNNYHTMLYRHFVGHASRRFFHNQTAQSIRAPRSFPQPIPRPPQQLLMYSTGGGSEDVAVNKKSLITKSARDTANWHGVQKVSTTHIVKKNEKTNGNMLYIGVFWDRGDPMNVFRACSTPGANVFHASIEAVIVALRQAIFERKLDRVIIQTDSAYLTKCANSYLKFWRKNGYKKIDGTPVKHREDLEDLDKLLNMIDAKVEHIQQPRGENVVLRQLLTDPIMVERVDAIIGTHSDVDMFNPNEVSSEFTQIIYVSGTVVIDFHSAVPFHIASYGIHFDGKETLNNCGRFAQFPVSMFRAQMYGILKALRQAMAQGMHDIHIVCDSGPFVKYYKREWKKNDGNFVANHHLYEKIAKLAEDLHVKFSYVQKNDSHIKTAALLAQDGLVFPIVKDDDDSAGEESDSPKLRRRTRTSGTSISSTVASSVDGGESDAPPSKFESSSESVDLEKEKDRRETA